MALDVADAAGLDECMARVAGTFGTPCFVYVTSGIEKRISELRQAFGGRFSLSFAVKSNPNPGLLSWLKGRIDYLDVSSIGEMRLGVGAGWRADRLSFTGPGKRDFEIREAVANGVGELVLESVREAVVADEVARSTGRVQDVMVRIAPARVPKGFGDQMAGRPSAFGVDIEVIESELPKILTLANLRVVGLHIYSGTQCLKPEAICENYRIFHDIFRSVCERHDLRPSKLVFGSGLGIPYHEGDTPLDLEVVASGVVGDLDTLKANTRFKQTELILELGRYLVGEAGYFLTKVISIKESRGVRIGICDGGMNNHLPASGHFGMVIHRNYKMHLVGQSGVDKTVTSEDKVNLVGPLCTSIDRLASGIVLPGVAEGSLIAVHNSGAYGLTASPLHFISHGLPREILVEASGARDVTRIHSDI